MLELFGISKVDRKFLTLALRRYPDAGLMAMEFLRSDRQHAGLGALDERKRSQGWREGAYARKFIQFIDRRQMIVYRWGAVSHPSWEYAPQSVSGRASSVIGDVASLTVTRRSVPARNDHWGIQFDADDLRSQAGRDMVARALREARRSTARTLTPTPVSQ